MQTKKLADNPIAWWANYVKTHPGWKKIHTKFINAQFAKHKDFIKRLLKTPGGKEKYQKLYGREP